MNNPFKYGEIALNDSFCNRTREIKRLHQSFRDGQNIVLISPRRWGKSSLVSEALSRYKGKLLVARIDCFGIRSEDEFYTTLLKAVLKASESRIQEMTRVAKSFLSTLVPYITFSTGPSDEVKISFTRETKQDTDQILDLAQKIAQERGVRLVLCVDEFQQINEWENGDLALQKLRSHWQRHKDVCYCLYGSKRHLMNLIFNDSSHPFYRFGETLFLEKIAQEEWVEFIINKFSETGKQISEPLAIRLAQLGQCHSYYVQYLGRICWNNTEKRVTDEIVSKSFDDFLTDHTGLFTKETEDLTKYQINYLRAFCAGERKFTSQRVLRQYQLGSAGNIRRIEKVMEDAEIIDYFAGEPVFCDPYFEPLFRRYFMADS